MKIKELIKLIIVLVLVTGTSGCSSNQEENVRDSENIYVVFNESLCYSNMQFTESMLGYEAIALDKLIGETSDGKQVFSIKGEDSNDFICLRVEGEEKIFQNDRLIPLSDVKMLDINKIVVRNDNAVEDETEITDKDVIERMLNQINDKNIVIDEVIGEKFKDFSLYSSKLKGICYKYSYVVDEFGDEYIYDPHLGYAWKFEEKIFEID